MTIKDEMIKKINNNSEYFKLSNLEDLSSEELIEVFKFYVGDFEKFVLNYLCNVQFEVIKMMRLSNK